MINVSFSAPGLSWNDRMPEAPLPNDTVVDSDGREWRVKSIKWERVGDTYWAMVRVEKE